MTEDLVLVVALEVAVEEEDIRHLVPTAIKRKLEREKHNIDDSLEIYIQRNGKDGCDCETSGKERDQLALLCRQTEMHVKTRCKCM